MRSPEDVKAYVDERIPDFVTFQCEEIKMLRTKANARSQFLSCMFKWKDGDNDVQHGYRLNVINIKYEIDKKIEMVKSLTKNLKL